MKAITLSLLLASSVAAGASAQVLMEHAAAVAGATVGTVGGKVLSNALDKTLGKAADVGNATQATTAKKPDTPNATAKEKTAPTATTATAAATAGPSGSRASSYSRTSHRSTTNQSFGTEERSIPAPMVQAVSVPASPTATDFAKMREGLSRDEVFVALGTPSSHVTIPDDGHLVEILTYSSAGERLGTIHVDNGQVVSVKAVSPK